MGVRGQPVRVKGWFFIIPRGSQESDSGCPAWWQAPLSAEPFCWPHLLFRDKLSHWTWASVFLASLDGQWSPRYTYLCLPSVQHLGTWRSKPHTCSANMFPSEPSPWCRPSVSFLGWRTHGTVLTCERHQETLIDLNFRTHFKYLEHAAS